MEVNHIAIIMDGNRRWAKEKNLASYKGHEEGAKRVEELLNWIIELKIKELTLYTLSIENLNRTQEELSHLFRLFKIYFKKFKKDKRVKENKIKIKFIGDLSLVSEDIRTLSKEIEEDTKEHDNYTVNFCFAYGGRQELVHTFNNLKDKKTITEEDITNSLWLKNQPDIVIRTGNAQRTSNFLPWQTIYSEWIFMEKMWPDFSKQDLLNCLQEFKSRKRNFGI